ncbi:MAG: UDP-glucose--hexose-1-phosphate uridylyltransferase [Clostridia bacterium]
MDKQIAGLIEDLVLYARKNLDLCTEDAVVARNQLLELYSITNPSERQGIDKNFQTEILDKLVNFGLEMGLGDSASPVLLETKIMGLVCPSAGLVVNIFNQIKEKNGLDKALEYFYKISVNSNYIRMCDVNKNICWYSEGVNGQVGITINLSKPEKDPKQVLAEKNFKGNKYPKCMLCLENIGFQGNLRHPARQTLRIIPIKLNNENWHLQYSPYVYYDQHCIAFCDEHRPMKITPLTFVRLCDFVDIIPQYFMGSNADLPIVGGSILAHDHYQGGKKVLPMLSRPIRKSYLESKEVSVDIKDWYNSVVSVHGIDKNKVIAVATEFLNTWREYTDESVGILATSNGECHNTITPISHKEGKEYVLDLILRNNRTDENHPFGIFHPTVDMHNIKKEGIGLIEAMGLFILPGRLKKETATLIELLQKGNIDFDKLANDESINKHIDMLKSIYETLNKNGVDEETAKKAVSSRIEKTCFAILECTAVFKNTTTGQNAFDKYVNLVLSKINN